MQRQSTQPAPIAKRSSSGVTRTRPSPSTASSVSPKKKAGSRSIKRTDDETCDEDELSDEENKDKLEEKREKNRVKQRNLRLRRANHINELESLNTGLRAEIAHVRQSVTALQQRENNLNAWVRDLESALFAHGLSTEVNQLRRIWAASTALPRNDPLATLASAAAVSVRPVTPGQFRPHPNGDSQSGLGIQGGVGIPYPTPDLSYDSQMPPAWTEEKKRKRMEDHASQQPPHTRRHDTLPPFTAQPLPPLSGFNSSRPSTAPHLPPIFQAPTSETRSQSFSIDQTGPRSSSSSPHRLRISDLLSPVQSDSVQAAHLALDSSTDAESESDRRWSAGEISVKLSPRSPILRLPSPHQYEIKPPMFAQFHLGPIMLPTPVTSFPSTAQLPPIMPTTPTSIVSEALKPALQPKTEAS